MFGTARAALLAFGLVLVALAQGSCSCGGGPGPSDSGSTGGTDALPITLDSGTGGDAGSDAGGGCTPACGAGMWCLHGCTGTPACFMPPAGCAGCSVSCNPCSPGDCGTITATDVFCTCP